MTTTTSTTATATALRGIFALSIVARLPLATFSIGLLVHVEHLTGSFTRAGAAAGALAVAQAVGGPFLGRLVDRRGQTRALLASAAAAAGAVAAIAMLPAGAPLLVVLALAVALGLSTPPVGACMRTLFPDLLPSAEGQRRAYAVDAAATELTWVAGPPLVLLVGAFWGTGTALVAVGGVLLTATGFFAASPASRAWRPVEVAVRPSGGALRIPAMRTLVLVLIGAGIVFGATEVAITGAADGLGHAAMAGPLLGLWGAGSLIGGVVAARLGGGARTATGFALLLAALGAGHAMLAPAAGNIVALAVMIGLAGTMIAPILASAYAMVDAAVPAGFVTEAFAWLATATAVGTSMGAATAGALADATGPAAGFILAGIAALAAALVAVLRASTLPGSRRSDALPEPAAPVAATAAA